MSQNNLSKIINQNENMYTNAFDLLKNTLRDCYNFLNQYQTLNFSAIPQTTIDTITEIISQSAAPLKNLLDEAPSERTTIRLDPLKQKELIEAIYANKPPTQNIEEQICEEPKSKPFDTMYFIDLENTGRRWLLHEYPQKSKIWVLVGKNPNKELDSDIEIIKSSVLEIDKLNCYTGCENALDSQLDTLLGHEICDDRAKEYVIMANDKGYDYVCKFWQLFDVKINRLPVPEETSSTMLIENCFQKAHRYHTLGDPYSDRIRMFRQYLTEAGFNAAQRNEICKQMRSQFIKYFL